MFSEKYNYPLVSIGIPVYNGASYLRETLNAILAQTYKNIEIIISDNSSSDGTELICQEYSNLDSRISYYRHPENRGVVANFQFLLDKSKGEYFSWAAADDRLDQNWIEVLLDLLLSDERAAMAFGSVKYVDAASNQIDAGLKFRMFKEINSSKGQLLRMIESIQTRSDFLYYGLHRKKLLERVKLTLSSRTSSVNEQGTALLYLIVSFGGIKSSTDTFLYYRIHNESNAHKGKMTFKEIRILKKAHAYLANYYLKNYAKNLRPLNRFIFIFYLKLYLFMSDYVNSFRLK